MFGPSRVAVFVDGCFWHGCPAHFSLPQNNADWWADKIQANRDRDARAATALAGVGWLVIRVWEHEDVHEAANRIESEVHSRRPTG